MISNSYFGIERIKEHQYTGKKTHHMCSSSHEVYTRSLLLTSPNKKRNLFKRRHKKLCKWKARKNQQCEAFLASTCNFPIFKCLHFIQAILISLLPFHHRDVEATESINYGFNYTLNKRWKIHAWKISFHSAERERRVVFPQQNADNGGIADEPRYSTFLLFIFRLRRSFTLIFIHLTHNNVAAFNKHSNSTRDEMSAMSLFRSLPLLLLFSCKQQAQI